MRKLIGIIGVGLGAAVACASLAAAATLSLGSRSLSAGNAAVTSCGVSSLTASRGVDDSGNVTGVSVSGIPAACSGETLSVTLRSSSGASLGSASKVLGGCSSTCSASFTSFGATIAGTALGGYAFALTGP